MIMLNDDFKKAFCSKAASIVSHDTPRQNNNLKYVSTGLTLTLVILLMPFIIVFWVIGFIYHHAPWKRESR